MRSSTGAQRMGLRLFHAVWGLPQNLVGALVALVSVRSPHRVFRTALITEWPLDRGLSLGLFVFVPPGCQERLIVHEYGHCVQSMVLGPLYLPVMVLPSMVWAGLPAFERLRRERGISYYDMPVEHWADVLGARVCAARSEG